MSARSWPRWIGFALPAALIAAMQIDASLGGVRSDSLASPREIATAFAEVMRDESLLSATAETLGMAGLGLLGGCLIGIPTGILLGFARAVDHLAFVPIELLRPVPVVALIPVCMLVFGLGVPLEVTLVALATLWPMLLLTRAAALAVEPRLLEVARTLRMPRRMIVRTIILPTIVPRVVVALRLSVGIALIVAVTIEIAANPLGLGYGMMQAVQSLHPDVMFAFLAWLAFVGWAINAALEAGIQVWLRRRGGA